ncbi:MAG: sugar-binding transcriptional regulator [Chloroflexi bacterium]|nr:sugar-binding transcriptional regulator [Chloroflexota bacterium]
MSQQQNQQLMLQAARLYYEQNHTQDEIARALKTSRPMVSRLLQQARAEGIVQIKIVDPSARHSALEKQLLEKFHLTDVMVVATEGDTQELARRRIGQAAARYLERTLQNGDVVGIGWGRSLYEVVNALEPHRKARITVVPLIGGLGQISPVFQVHELTRLLAEAFGGTWQNFYTPALVESDEMVTTLLRSADGKQVTALWQHLSVAVVGIGNVDLGAEMQMLFVNYLDAEAQKRLSHAKAVGDICVRFFDIKGKPCADAMHGIVGISLEQLHRTRRVIGIAGGIAKAEAILGALKGRHVNVLVTDEPAARRVLELTPANDRKSNK